MFIASAPEVIFAVASGHFFEGGYYSLAQIRN